MAFENVNSKGYKYQALAKLEIGASITGYVIGFEQSAKYKDKTNIIIKDAATGERVSLSTAGNVNYMLKDGKIKAGLNTRFTRLEDKNVKGKKSTQFTVEQDPEDTIEVAPATQPAAQQPSASSMASTLSSLKGLQ